MSIFSNAKIVCHTASPNQYAEEKEERGSPKLTVRAHVLSEILRNPRRWRNGYQSPESKAKEYGELLDCLALTPMQWPRRFVVEPQTYPAPASHEKVKKGTIAEGDPLPWNNNATICKTWSDEQKRKGLTLVDFELNGKVHAALRVLQADPKASELLKSGVAQVWVAAEYKDKQTGLVVPVKCLIDLVPLADHPLYGEYLVDLKTSKSAAPGWFARDVYKYGYDLQAAWYLDLYNAASGEQRIDFAHIVQENFPPYETRVPILGRRFVERGRLRYHAALEVYCRCVCSGHWPGYDVSGCDWPITEPEEWMLSFENVYPPEMQKEPEPEPEEEPNEVTP